MRKCALPVLLFFVLVGCERLGPVQEISVRSSGLVEELPRAEPAAGDWPWWRGAGRNGVSLDTNVPITWSSTENIVWRAHVPGRGHGSPCVWGEQIFLATADESNQVQLVLCYDRTSGERLWRTPVHRAGFERKHRKNSYASSTPACDGERVYVPFLNRRAIYVTATDLEGNIVWQTEAGPFKSQHGYGASPVLYKSFVIVSGENYGQGFLAALHRETGEIMWRIKRPNVATFSSPIVAQVAGRAQLLLCGAEAVSSYNPDTGQRLWYCEGTTEVTAGTMTFGKDVVYASGGYPDKELLCIRADGSGHVTETHIVWRTNRGVAYVPSPLVHEGYLYVVNDGGIASCFEAESGRVVWRQRLRGNFSASPTFAAGYLFVPNETGTTFVFKAGPQFELVAENSLGDGGFASPAISREQILVRTNHYLYLIGSSSAAETVGASP